jgi:hypothetical protein
VLTGRRHPVIHSTAAHLSSEIQSINKDKPELSGRAANQVANGGRRKVGIGQRAGCSLGTPGGLAFSGWRVERQPAHAISISISILSRVDLAQRGPPPADCPDSRPSLSEVCSCGSCLASCRAPPSNIRRPCLFGEVAHLSQTAIRLFPFLTHRPRNKPPTLCYCLRAPAIAAAAGSVLGCPAAERAHSANQEDLERPCCG